jgi:hypothetical protein
LKRLVYTGITEDNQVGRLLNRERHELLLNGRQPLFLAGDPLRLLFDLAFQAYETRDGNLRDIREECEDGHEDEDGERRDVGQSDWSAKSDNPCVRVGCVAANRGRRIDIGPRDSGGE